MKHSAVLLCVLLIALLTACGSGTRYGYGPFDTIDHEDEAIAAEISEGKIMMQTEDAVMMSIYDSMAETQEALDEELWLEEQIYEEYLADRQAEEGLTENELSDQELQNARN